jgi:hypothetical protein
MPRALTIKLPFITSPWRAGNIARSRLSGGSRCIRTRPQELLGCGNQTSLNRILFYISPNPIELRAGSHQPIKALLLPKRSMGTEEKVGLVSREAFKRTQPFGGKHVWGDQQMNMSRHDDERMQLIATQFAVSVQQCGNDHICNFRPAQEQRPVSACVQQAVDGYECFTRGHKCRRREDSPVGKAAMQPERDEQGLLDYFPMGQPSFVMPHTPTWCASGREALTASSRLKAGCGQYCPPSNAASL